MASRPFASALVGGSSFRPHGLRPGLTDPPELLLDRHTLQFLDRHTQQEIDPARNQGQGVPERPPHGLLVALSFGWVLHPPMCKHRVTWKDGT